MRDIVMTEIAGNYGRLFPVLRTCILRSRLCFTCTNIATPGRPQVQAHFFERNSESDFMNVYNGSTQTS